MASLLESICYPPPVDLFAKSDHMTLSEYLWFCEILRQPHNRPRRHGFHSMRPLHIRIGSFESLECPREPERKAFGSRRSTVSRIARSSDENIRTYSHRCDTNEWRASARHLVPFLEQTINGACGFYPILHALSHGPPASMLGSNSLLTDVLVISNEMSLAPDNYALALELNKPLEEAYTDIAIQGDSVFASEEPAIRYICMVKSFDGNLYHLDAKRNRPGNLGPSTENVLSDRCLDHVNRVIEATTGKKPITMLGLISGQRSKERKQKQVPQP
ncbi:ubiquitin c-terminal hydrolase l3 [Paraphaeosphaeria sporulosa]